MRLGAIGVGGCGINTLEYLVEMGPPIDKIIAVNSDQAAIDQSSLQHKIFLDTCLNSEKKAEQAIEANSDALKQLFSGLGGLVCLTGLGGNTGTLAAPEIAKLAKHSGLKVWAVVTMPFRFEGERRAIQAREGLSRLIRYADTVISIPNQCLIEGLSKETTMDDAFRMVNAEVVKVIKRILSRNDF